MKNMPAGQWRCIIGQTDTLLSVSSRTAGAPRCFSLKSGAIITTPQCKRGCLRAMTYRHVETVVLLSQLRQKPDDYIDVDIDVAELEGTSAETKATYEKIKKYVAEHNDGMKVSNLYIAQVKRKCGIELAENFNLPKSEDARQPRCPKEKEEAIVEALKAFQMI